MELSNLSQNINEKTAQFKDYSEKLTIAESDLANALMALEQEKLSRQTFEDDSVQDITDLRSKLADAIAARWAALQSQKEALENLKNVLAAKLVSEKLNAESTSNLEKKEILLQKAPVS